jgi:hypothetical protein
MTAVHSVKQVPPWAVEKPAPHFGKPAGLPRLLEAVQNYVRYFWDRALEWIKLTALFTNGFIFNRKLEKVAIT